MITRPGARPNVLLLMADQLTPGWLPAYGGHHVSAPNLDRLAAGSTVFDAAYCASPLCAPSRAALLTGRLPSRTGAYDNAAELPSSVPTLAHLLRAAGYRTALSGKMHFVGADQQHGYEERLTTDVYPADLDWTPDWRLPVDAPVPWYHTMESVLRAAPCRASMQADYDDDVAFRAVRRLYEHARSPEHDPLFLTVSFTHPHDPWEERPEYWDRYDPDELPLPEVPSIPLDKTDPHSARLRAMYGTDAVPLTEEQVRRARHGYAAAVSYVDERVGQVLDALDDAGLADDTIVLFTADHGEMLGERGLWYKMSFFEPSVRVPLLVRVPGADAAPERCASPVSLLDVLPTVLDLAGVPSGPEDGVDVDGRSLAGVLAGSGTRPGAVLSEYLAEGTTAPAVMVRRGPYKFVRCPGDPDQLYDLDHDPHETDDLADAAERSAVAAALGAEVDARWDLAALDARVRSSQRDRLTVAPALGRGTRTVWDHEPVRDEARRYVRTDADMYELQRRSRLDVP